MKDTLVGFKVAKLAKEKGFNIPTIQFYTSGKKPYLTEAEDYMTERYAESNWNNEQGSYPTKAEDVSCSAPTQSLLQKWLDIIHNKYVHVEKHNRNGLKCYSPFIDNIPVKEAFFNDYDKPEEAWEIGLQEALKLIK